MASDFASRQAYKRGEVQFGLKPQCNSGVCFLTVIALLLWHPWHLGSTALSLELGEQAISVTHHQPQFQLDNCYWRTRRRRREEKRSLGRIESSINGRRRRRRIGYWFEWCNSCEPTIDPSIHRLSLTMTKTWIKIIESFSSSFSSKLDAV